MPHGCRYTTELCHASLVESFVDAIRPAPGPRSGQRQSSAAGEQVSSRRGQRIRTAGEIATLLEARELPRAQWKDTLDRLAVALEGCKVTVEVQDCANRRVEQSDLPLDGIGADVKDNESVVNVTVGKEPRTQVTHSIRARGIRLQDDGDSKLLRIESADGTNTIVRFRTADVKRVA